VVPTSQCSIKTMYRHRCHRLQRAQCLHLHSSTHGQLQSLVTLIQGIHDHRPTMKDMEVAWNLRGGQSTGALSRSIIHRSTGYI
jgi:hypothetical protein